MIRTGCIFYIREYDMGATIEDCGLRSDWNVYPTHLPYCDGCKDYRSFEDAKKQMRGDYVEVVRCKDCVHCETFEHDGVTDYYCPWLAEMPVSANWYCGDGERKCSD